MEQFGRYQLVHQLATGGMGEIFLARSASIDGFAKDLVIKRIRAELTANVQLVSMFLNEAQITMSLSHQNVVQVFDFGQVDDTYFLAMEHVHGCDLIQVLNLDSVLGTGLPPGLALYVMSEVCRGLDYAHTSHGIDGNQRNLIHRDISPDNVMISKDGGVKITDFGISSFADQIGKRKSQRLEGKVPYMSPEQARTEATDARSDVYSCGIVLWELLTGEPAFPGEINREMLQRVQTAEIDRAIRRNRKLTRKLDKLVMTALQPDPSKRFQSAREFGDAMRTLLSKKYGGLDSYALRSYVEENRSELQILDLARIRPATQMPSFTSPETSVLDWSTEFDFSPDIIKRARDFCEAPSLLALVTLAELLDEQGDPASSSVAYRIAMIKFTQQGLLAQALNCAIRLQMLRPNKAEYYDLSYVPSLVGYSNERLLPYLFSSPSSAAELMSYMIASTLSERVSPAPPTIWLSQLSGAAFSELSRLAKLQKYSPAEKIVSEGDEGNSMFLLVSGRTIVYTSSETGEKIYLASLSPGDFFGEQSFFGQPIRNATIEAMEMVEVIEFDRDLVDRVMRESPDAEALLLTLYKDRVVDGILARSKIFGVLSVQGRKVILKKLIPKTVFKDEILIKEGEMSREAYIVKSGKAEAFVKKGGETISVGLLGPGTIIGETAALKNSPRSASVRALETMDVLEMPEEVLMNLQETAPQLLRKIDTVAEKRQQSRADIFEFNEVPDPGSKD